MPDSAMSTATPHNTAVPDKAASKTAPEDPSRSQALLNALSLEETPRKASAQKSSAIATRIMERLRGFFGKASMREEIEEALDNDKSTQDFSPEEKTILKNVLGIHDLRVADVMVPRADIIAIPATLSLREVLESFRTNNHSRLPVYGDTLDDPLGMVHIRDFVDYLASAAERHSERHSERLAKSGKPDAPETKAEAEAANNLDTKHNPFSRLNLSLPLSKTKILRQVLYAPPSMPALDLLAKMRATRTHMALVIDEYGGTDGLVSIEDIVETIVGDISDEHDEEEGPMVTLSASGALIVDARAPLDDVTNALGFDFGSLIELEEIDTIGGLISLLAGRVPLRGEIIEGPDNIEFEILEADPRKIKRVRILRDNRPAGVADNEAKQSGQDEAIGVNKSPAPNTQSA